MPSNLVLIDGDILVYRVAFSCQAKNNEGEVEILSEGIARARMDQMIEDILENTEADSCMGFLTDGKGNFRNQVAKTQPYKGGRLLEKPVHYDFLRKYLEEEHAYEMCTTQEADDMIGITHMDITGGDVTKPVIIASIDKDLLMIPGKHYHIGTREVAEVSIFQAMKKFFTQVLTGDRTDNILGLRGIGPVKAEKILESRTNFAEMVYSVKDVYQKANALDRLGETAELIWIRRIAGVPFGFVHAKDVYELYHQGGK